jgi:hypothetical protein
VQLELTIVGKLSASLRGTEYAEPDSNSLDIASVVQFGVVLVMKSKNIWETMWYIIDDIFNFIHFEKNNNKLP